VSKTKIDSEKERVKDRDRERENKREKERKTDRERKRTTDKHRDIPRKLGLFSETKL